MLTELRKVIPSFLKRVDLTDRGVAASTYLAGTRMHMEELAAALPRRRRRRRVPAFACRLRPRHGIKLVASMLYPYTQLSDAEIETRVRAMSVDERLAVMRTYVGDRSNRRHRPGRAFERPGYRFDILADYGAFRDLQRRLRDDRMAGACRPVTATPGRGRRPCGLTATFDEAMERSALLSALADRFPVQAPCGVARVPDPIRHGDERPEAMHLIELRTTPQGHPAYRVVAQQMHRLIAGRPAIARSRRR